MKITKIGHSCILIEKDGTRILVDPGTYSSQSELEVDAILITHEHADHMDVECINALKSKNPSLKIYTNQSAAKKLPDAIAAQEREEITIKQIKVLPFRAPHSMLYPGILPAQNIGFMIDELCFPGDSLQYPPRQPTSLALPVSGPWLKVSEAIDYALMVRPKTCFPIHDGMLMPERKSSNYIIPKQVLSQHEIEFVPLENGQSIEVQ